MPVLAMSAGTVTAVWGTAYIRLPNGSLKPIHVGDKVAGGAHIVTEDDGIVEIMPSKGHPVVLAATPETVNKVITGIEALDPEQVPAAGVTGGADGGMQPGLRVDRVSESVGQQAFQFSDTSAPAAPVSLGSSADQRPLVLNEAEATPSSTTPAAGPRVLSVSDAQTGEGGTLDFHIKLTNDSATASQDSTLVIKLSGVGAHPAVPGIDTSTVKVSFDGGAELDAIRDAQGNIIVPVSASLLAGTDIVLHVQTEKDGVYEGPETIQLSAATNHDTAPVNAVGTITDDADRPYMLVLNGEPATEGEPIGFNVVLTHASTTPVTVKLTLQDGTDDPTTPENEGATLGVDTGTQLEYETADGSWLALPASNELTFEPGQTQLHVRVATVYDNVAESTEFIKLEATVVEGDTVNQSQSNQTAIIDARPYMLVLNGEPATEGDPVGFNVVLTHAVNEPVTVKLALQDGTDDPTTPENEGATLGADTGTQLEYETADGTWVALPESNQLTFEPGQTLLHVRVATVYDNVAESTEFIKLEATVVEGNTANHSQSNQTAIIDAPPYMLVLNGEPATEGDPIGFNVVLTHAVNEPVTVKLALQDGMDDPTTPENEGATLGVDTGTQLEYEAVDGSWVALPASNELTFEPGQTQLHLRVATIHDNAAESTEFIKLEATVVAGNTANHSQFNQTAIIDNDGAVSASTTDSHATGAFSSGTEIVATPAADVFAWHLGDQGTAEAPSVYTIKGFEAKTPAAGGDALDLRDLLQGEHTSDGGIGNLDHYLRIDSSDTSSTIRISPTGDFVPGDAHSGADTQRIVLDGVNLRAAMSLDAAAPDAQVIASLLQQNKLLVDHA